VKAICYYTNLNEKVNKQNYIIYRTVRIKILIPDGLLRETNIPKQPI